MQCLFISTFFNFRTHVTISTFAHETGHALAVQACYGTYKELGIGGHAQDQTFLTIPLVNIKCKGADPRIGYTRYSQPKNQTRTDHLKEMAIDAAGPLFGIITSLISLKLLNNYTLNKYPISKAICYYSLWTDIADNVIPDGCDNDGQHIIDSYRAYKKF